MSNEIPPIVVNVSAVQAKWKLIAAVVLFIAVYVLWSVYGKRDQTAEDGFQETAPAVRAPKISIGKPVVIKALPTEVVLSKYPGAKLKPNEVFIDSARIPKAPHGGTTLTTMDTASGEARTEFKANPSPWFAFERGNTLGAGLEAGTRGIKAEVYYKRDILRIKDVVISGGVGVRAPAQTGQKDKEVEFRGTLSTEWRF